MTMNSVKTVEEFWERVWKAKVREVQPIWPQPAAEFRPDAVSHRHTLKCFTRGADLLYAESKEIVEGDSLGGYEIGGGRRLVVAANEIHIFRGPRAFSQTQVEGQRSFQNPAVWRSDGEAHEEAVEDDCLSQADERSAPVTRSYEQAPLKGLTKCGSASVLHWRLRSWIA